VRIVRGGGAPAAATQKLLQQGASLPLNNEGNVTNEGNGGIHTETANARGGAPAVRGQGQGQNLSRNTEAANAGAGATLQEQSTGVEPGTQAGNAGAGAAANAAPAQEQASVPVQTQVQARPAAPTGLTVSGGSSVPQSVELAQSSFTRSVNGEAVTIRATDGRILGDFTATRRGQSQTRGLTTAGQVVVSLRGLRSLSNAVQAFDSGEVDLNLYAKNPDASNSKQVGVLMFTIAAVAGSAVRVDVRLATPSAAN
jgi:hypothetical protein